MLGQPNNIPWRVIGKGKQYWQEMENKVIWKTNKIPK